VQTLDERILTEFLPYRGLGWTRTDPRFPRQVGSVPTSLVGKGPANCVTLTTGVIMGAFPNVPWTHDDYRDLMLWDGARKWSPMESVIRRGVGTNAGIPNPTGWTLVQGWGAGGHAFLTRGLGGRLIVYESSRSARGTRARVATAAEIKSDYSRVGYAWLHEYAPGECATG